VSMPLVLVSYEAMQPYGWSSLHIALLMLPPLPILGLAALGCIKRLLCICLRRRRAAESPIVAALVVGAALSAEAALASAKLTHLPTAHWISLAATRYFCLRWEANTLVYIHQQAAKVCCEWCTPVALVLELGGQTVGAYALLVDFFLGLMLQLPVHGALPHHHTMPRVVEHKLGWVQSSIWLRWASRTRVKARGFSRLGRRRRQLHVVLA